MEVKSGTKQSKKPEKAGHPFYVLPQSPDRIQNPVGVCEICLACNFRNGFNASNEIIEKIDFGFTEHRRGEGTVVIKRLTTKSLVNAIL